MRTGLFLSRDDGRISDAVDVDALAQAYSHLSAARVYDNFFRLADQQDMLRTVVENRLDAVVLAGNSPKYFGDVLGGGLILKALNGHGINENKIAFANIREQVALAHPGEREGATKKARLLIDVALAKVEASHDVKSITVAPRRAVLVVGTTAGGIIAAAELLSKGFKVYLVEKEGSLRVRPDMERDLLPSLTAVQSDPRVRIFFSTGIQDVSGYCGEYNVVVATPQGKEELQVGGIILSVGDDLEWIEALRPKMRLNTDSEGYLRHETKIAGQTLDPGIWFVPFSGGRDTLASEISGAAIAVLSLASVLEAPEVAHPLLVSAVDESVCGGCGTCVKTCAFSASSIDVARRLSVIDTKRCKGCGNCVTACPTGARDLVTFPREYVGRAIDILSDGVLKSSEPKILTILCNHCGYSAMDAAGELIAQDPSQRLYLNAMPLLVECGGQVDTQYILSALSKGFDGVLLFVCQDGHCRNVVGNTDMQRRLGLFRAILRSRNIDAERLRVVPVTCEEGTEIIQEVRSLSEELRAMAVGV